MEKRILLEEMPHGKPKEIKNLREELRPTPKKTKIGRLQKMMSLVANLMKKWI